jgi:hypothetical protein
LFQAQGMLHARYRAVLGAWARTSENERERA